MTLQAPGDQGSQLDIHMLAEGAVADALFDQSDHVVGIEPYRAVGGNIPQLAAANHAANLDLLDTQYLSSLCWGEHQAPSIDRHAIDHHMGHSWTVVPGTTRSAIGRDADEKDLYAAASRRRLPARSASKTRAAARALRHWSSTDRGPRWLKSSIS